MFCLNEIHKWEISAIVTPERCPYIKRLSEKKKIRLVANQLCRSLCYCLQKIYGTVIFQQIDSLHIFTEKIKLEKSLVCLGFHQSTKKSCNWNHAIPPKSLKYVKMCGSIHGWHFGPVNTFHSLKNRHLCNHNRQVHVYPNQNNFSSYLTPESAINLSTWKMWK